MPSSQITVRALKEREREKCGDKLIIISSIIYCRLMSHRFLVEMSPICPHAEHKCSQHRLSLYRDTE